MDSDRQTTRQRAEALVSTVPPLLVAAERVAATVAQGVHGRRRVGTGESFWQFRQYQQGDPIQRIDWRQTAKTDTVYIRELEWEAAQTIWLWRDASPSMDYRSRRDLPSKRERAEILLLALAILLSRGGERMALLGGGHMATTGQVAVNRILQAFESSADTTGTDADGLPGSEDVPRHGELVMIGDLLSPLEAIDKMVGRYVNRGVRGHMLQILDSTEVTLPFGGRVRFAGFEGERETLIPRVESIREAYLDRLQAQQDGLRALCRSAGWTFSTHCTDNSPQTALLSLYAALSQEPVDQPDARVPAAGG
ncbi:MAG: DUF58 domain-containing protein [Inquilinus sp.]|nr:DUF58 domain-containing protein [Inquilinus sp.]